MKKVLVIVLAVIVVFSFAGCSGDSDDKAGEGRYEKAKELFYEGEYEEAKDVFEDLGYYLDSYEMVKECDYQRALDYYDDNNTEKAKVIFKSLGNYKDSGEMAVKCDVIGTWQMYKMILDEEVDYDIDAGDYTTLFEEFFASDSENMGGEYYIHIEKSGMLTDESVRWHGDETTNNTNEGFYEIKGDYMVMMMTREEGGLTMVPAKIENGEFVMSQENGDSSMFMYYRKIS